MFNSLRFLQLAATFRRSRLRAERSELTRRHFNRGAALAVFTAVLWTNAVQNVDDVLFICSQQTFHYPLCNFLPFESMNCPSELRVNLYL